MYSGAWFWFSGLGYFGLLLMFVVFMVCCFALVGLLLYRIVVMAVWLWVGAR